MKIIITKSQYKLLLEGEFKGTKRLLGANGIDSNLFNEILHLMQTAFVGEHDFNIFNSTAIEVTKNQKVSNKDKKTITKALDAINEKCLVNQEFNSDRYENFCYNINEILHSDNDNKFSLNYGWVKK